MIGVLPDMWGIRVAARKVRAVGSLACGSALVCPGMNTSRSSDALPPPEENTRVALVTGAARSIGAANAKETAQHRVRVALSDGPASALESVAVSCDGKAYCPRLPCEGSVETACQGVTGCAGMDLGRLDVLVNNAGTWVGEPFLAAPASAGGPCSRSTPCAGTACPASYSPARTRRLLAVVNVASQNALQAETLLIGGGGQHGGV
jgi:NAD(P)-dependent dehydrogenase (short-subunit alcohol dehydrogenase family)